MSEAGPTPAPNRRWFRFSLTGLLVITAMSATAVWTSLVALDARQVKAEAELLKQENAWLKTRILSQERLKQSMQEIAQGKFIRPAPGTVPDHWLEATETDPLPAIPENRISD